MPDSRVSVLILAKNEAQKLPDCLASVRWADEVVVVVDRESRDDTEAVARRAATVVVVRDFADFASQRNAALALASGEWVFALDADERVTPELASEIRRTTSDPSLGHNGYRVPIRSVILGRPFSFSGTQHDRPLRLFRRGMGRWVGAVHETVELQGSAGTLRHELTHHTLEDMKTFLRKLDEYTTLEAQTFEREGRRLRVTDLSVRPAWTFLKLYFGKAGFRDGLEGFVFCALSGFSVAIRNWKYRERVRARGAP